ncbi:hypothetical protein HDU76_005335 [Blyttiomyces sp. JEL0837]|nr:hypothetical protein HDU76_005335 [Blyttiomyces sp. JEL0837]
MAIPKELRPTDPNGPITNEFPEQPPPTNITRKRGAGGGGGGGGTLIPSSPPVNTNTSNLQTTSFNAGVGGSSSSASSSSIIKPHADADINEYDDAYYGYYGDPGFVGGMVSAIDDENDVIANQEMAEEWEMKEKGKGKSKVIHHHQHQHKDQDIEIPSSDITEESIIPKQHKTRQYRRTPTPPTPVDVIVVNDRTQDLQIEDDQEYDEEEEIKPRHAFQSLSQQQHPHYLQYDKPVPLKNDWNDNNLDSVNNLHPNTASSTRRVSQTSFNDNQSETTSIVDFYDTGSTLAGGNNGNGWLPDEDYDDMGDTSNSNSHNTSSNATVTVLLNNIPFQVLENTPISLQLLNLGMCNFLYVDGVYVQLKRDGVPEDDIILAKDGMVLRTEAYPPIFPLDLMYWTFMRHIPSRTKIATFLSSPWGTVTYNCINLMITALLARPLLNSNQTTVQVVVSVITGARIVDTLVNDTLYTLLNNGTLRFIHILTILMAAQSAAMITGSIPIYPCIKLLEYRLIPSLLLLYTQGFPFMHRVWIVLGTFKKQGVVSEWVVLLGVWGPVVLGVLAGLVDGVLRVRTGWVDPLTCQVGGIGNGSGDSGGS